MMKIDAFYFLLIIEFGFVFLAWAAYASYKARKYRKMLLVASRDKVDPQESDPGKEEDKEQKDRIPNASEAGEKKAEPGPEATEKDGAPDQVFSEGKDLSMEKISALEKELSEKNNSLEEERKKSETLGNQLAEMNSKLEATKKEYGDLEKEYSILYSLQGKEKEEDKEKGIPLAF